MIAFSLRFALLAARRYLRPFRSNSHNHVECALRFRGLIDMLAAPNLASDGSRVLFSKKAIACSNLNTAILRERRHPSAMMGIARKPARYRLQASAATATKHGKCGAKA